MVCKCLANITGRLSCFHEAVFDLYNDLYINHYAENSQTNWEFRLNEFYRFDLPLGGVHCVNFEVLGGGASVQVSLSIPLMWV